MKNNIPRILRERGLSVAELHRKIIKTGQNYSYDALNKLAGPKAGYIADGVQIGTLRKIAGALDVGICDLIGETSPSIDNIRKFSSCPMPSRNRPHQS